MFNKQQAWIKSGLADSIFILSPPFLALVVVMLFPAEYKNSDIMPFQYWVILILMIDVAHVYSTLYRTYFNPDEFNKRHPLFIAIPFFCYGAGVVLYFLGGIIFWRALAYLAVYHFVRQQYGFMRIYSRKEKSNSIYSFIDAAAVYTATIYPLLYWHFAGLHKNFNWFVDGDFLLFKSATVLFAGKLLYILIIVVYLLKELFVIYNTKQFNIPKNLIILGTFLSWYLGIIYFNGDMAFTTLNVISHGIPYMALIWLFEHKKYKGKTSTATNLMRFTFSKYAGVILFVGFLVFFAYTEEGLWDGLVWKEHPQFFKPFSVLPAITENVILALTVPLLALPQSTHYVLDGFIWRLKKDVAI